MLDENLHISLNKNFIDSLSYTSSLLLLDIEDKLLDSSRKGYNYTVIFDEKDKDDERKWVENPIDLYVYGGLRNFLDTKVKSPYWIILHNSQLQLHWRIL